MARKPSYRTILVGVDFSPPSSKAFRHAVALARGLGARLEVAHAVPKLKPSVPFSATNRRLVKRLQKESVAEARGRLERLVGRATSGLKLRTAVLRGRPSEQLLAHARRRGADLIVVGQHGQSLAEHLLLGSTAERVARKAALPVLLVPSQD